MKEAQYITVKKIVHILIGVICKRRRKRPVYQLIAWGALCCIQTPLPAQYYAHDLLFEHGAPSAFVSDIRRDSRGFAWISTMEQLYRFDGKNYMSFGVRNEGSVGKVRGPVTEDRDANIWYCTQDGLYVIERKTGKIGKHLLRDTERGEPVSHAYQLLFQDASGLIWIKADKKLYWFDTRIAIASGILKNEALPKEVEGCIGEFRYTHVFPIPYGPKKGFCALYNHDFRSPGLTICSISQKGLGNKTELLPETHIKQIVQEEDGTVWIATDLGLLKMDEQFAHPDIFSTQPNIKSIALWPPGRMWAATKGEGLLLFDLKKGQIRQYLHDPYDPGSISNNSIEGIYLDADENLWLYIWTIGVDYTNLKKRKFGLVPIETPRSDDKKTMFIPEQLSEDSNGNIWCSSRKDGLVAFNPSKQAFTFPPNFKSVIQTLQASKNFMLIATMQGLMSYNHETGETLPVAGAPMPTAFMLKRRTDEKILAGAAFQKGLWELRFEKGRWVSDSIPHQQAAAASWGMLYEDWEGHLYGDCGKGLEVMDAQFNRIRPPIVFNGEVRCFAENESSVWAGGEYGLVCIDKTSGKHQFIGPAEGFPEAGVNGLFFHEKQGIPSLWVNSTKGFFQYNLQQKTVSNFEYRDGLISTTFSPHSSLVSSDSRFLFGGNKGLQIFQPSNLYTLQTPAYPHIVGLRVNDSLYAGISDPSELSEITLPYDRNNLLLNLIAVEFSDAPNNNLRYQLERTDIGWFGLLMRFLGLYSGEQNLSSILNAASASLPLKLQPGKYLLRIGAANSDGVWNAKEKELRIVIDPPFWQTTWFWCLVLITLLGLAYLFYKQRIQAVRKEEANKREQQRQKAELEMKAQRAQMNTHFIFNALEGIDGYIWDANTQDASKYLRLTAELARKVLRNSNYSNIPLQRELDWIDQFVEVRAMGWRDTIDYRVNVDDKAVNPDLTLIPGLLLQPFVENAILHGLTAKEGPRELSIDIKRSDNNALLCIIRDNGIGRAASGRLKKNGVGSHAIQLTKDRLKLYDLEHGGQSSINIIDLHEGEKPNGTQVEIYLDGA